jgi:hypothetical protein
MAEHAIRFSVCSNDGFRGATWKCWTPSGKEDVYLTCRELGGALKASLHESGRWHFAYDQSFFERSISETDRTERGRIIDSWQTPSPLAAGVILAFRIVTPWNSVCTPHEDLEPILRVPQPTEGRAIEFDLFLVNQGTPVSGWPGKDNMGTKLVGSYSLPSGTSVWVVYWDIPMPQLPAVSGPPKFFRGKSIEDLKNANLKILAFGDEPDGSKVIYECKVNYEARST